MNIAICFVKTLKNLHWLKVFGSLIPRFNLHTIVYKLITINRVHLLTDIDKILLIRVEIHKFLLQNILMVIIADKKLSLQ